MKQKIYIYRVNDLDFVAAKSKKDALECYATVTDVDKDTEIERLTEEEMDSHKFLDDPYNEPIEKCEKTFRMELDRQIAEGAKFPDMFASSEY